MAYSPLGFSLPELSIKGFASPAVSWGGPVTVTVNIHNLGSSTINEPLALSPGSTSSADAPASTVAVYVVKSAHAHKGGVLVGQFNVPALAQNSVQQLTTTLTMPTQPGGFSGDGGKVYLVFVANASGTVFQSDTSLNVSRPVSVLIEAPLPELATVGLDLPPVMQPGDTIQPNIRVTNLGPADTGLQGPVQVALVASTTKNFTLGSTIVALYTVTNIPGVSKIASQGQVFGDANLNPAQNVVTIAGDTVTLPISPKVYYLGVVIDPYNQIKQLSKVPQFTKPKNPFSLVKRVGPPIANLPPAGVLVAGGVANTPVFPIPFAGLPVGGSLDGTTFPAPFPPTPFTFASTTTTTTTPSPPILASSTMQSGVTTGARTPKASYSVAVGAGQTNFRGLSANVGRGVASAVLPKSALNRLG